jgi:hypothetical protein
MICSLCGRPFRIAVSFSTMFRAPRFCPRCRKRHRPDRYECAFPVDGGLVRYVHVFAEESEDYHLGVLLADCLGPLFLEAEGWSRSGAAVVLLDLAEVAFADGWFPAVSAFRDVRFLSLFFFDPERFVRES